MFIQGIKNSEELTSLLNDQILNPLNLVNHLSTYCGLICFSSARNKLLMWSHYADRHKGLVIGFDTKCLAEKWKNKDDFMKVEYKQKRMHILFSDIHSNEEAKAKELIKNKFKGWKYESEFRVIINLSECLPKKYVPRLKEDIYLIPFDKFAIKKVIFGCNMPLKHRDILRGIITKKYRYPIDIKYADTHGVNYQLLFTNLSHK